MGGEFNLLGFSGGCSSAQDALKNGLQAAGKGIPGEFADFSLPRRGQALPKLRVPDKAFYLAAQ
jgi:hypothetical protein